MSHSAERFDKVVFLCSRDSPFMLHKIDFYRNISINVYFYHFFSNNHGQWMVDKIDQILARN